MRCGFSQSRPECSRPNFVLLENDKIFIIWKRAHSIAHGWWQAKMRKTTWWLPVLLSGEIRQSFTLYNGGTGDCRLLDPQQKKQSAGGTEQIMRHLWWEMNNAGILSNNTICLHLEKGPDTKCHLFISLDRSYLIYPDFPAVCVLFYIVPSGWFFPAWLQVTNPLHILLFFVSRRSSWVCILLPLFQSKDTQFIWDPLNVGQPVTSIIVQGMFWADWTFGTLVCTGCSSLAMTRS